MQGRLVAGDGVHTKGEEMLGVGDTMTEVVVHRPVEGRGVKNCEQVGQMDWSDRE